MNTEKAIREAIRDHFSAVSDTDAAIIEGGPVGAGPDSEERTGADHVRKTLWVLSLPPLCRCQPYTINRSL